MLRLSPRLRNVQWSTTLNLPKSPFPPRAQEADRPAYLKACTDDLYSWQAAARRVEKPFVLHDGPPYANGSLHIGHALNKILKDVICRFHITQGERVHYRPGWDCHGLPIEIKALQQGLLGRASGPVDIRTAARKLATNTIEEQKDGFKQWGILGDWNNPYKTMSSGFETKQLGIFRSMVEKSLIYRQFKPVHWSPSSRTALAEAELEYDDEHVSHSAFIKYKISSLPSVLHNKESLPFYALIWTTTPWTLPANRAIAYHKNIQYCLFKPLSASELLLVARSRLDDVLKRAGLSREHVDIMQDSILGSDLFDDQLVTFYNPFRLHPHTEQQPFLHGDFVKEDSGTGLVHMAPGHGPDDYKICRQHGIDAFAPLDDEARFTALASPQDPGLLEGKGIVPEGVKTVLDHLKNAAAPGENLVWAEHLHTHKSPIDWRTKKPTIIRATAQWFAEVDSIKAQAMSALDAVEFLPPSGRSRLESFVQGRSQWCISRQRPWGVPIPALYRRDDEAVLTAASVDHIVKVISERGIDAWWTDAPDDPAWVAPDLPDGTYTRGWDTMDVWFDSGTTWTQVPERDGEPPADVYLEGTDQHRGWFQSSLLTYIAQQAQGSSSDHQSHNTKTTPPALAPFKTLITHGFILDAAGKKMSKSLGNVISPDQIMSGALLPPLKKRKGQKGPSGQLDAMGPDALRLWVAMSDYTHDVYVSEAFLKAVNGALHKYRVTFKWLLGALTDYVPPDPPLQPEQQHLTDHIALNQLYSTTTRVHAAYAAYDFSKATNAITSYINADLSAFYLETVKDPLYAGSLAERRRVQSTCFEILRSLLHMLKPVLPLLVTEVLAYSSPRLREALEPLGTPFLAQVWVPREEDFECVRWAPGFLQKVEPLFTLHSTVKSLQEEARKDKKMGSGLECRVGLKGLHVLDITEIADVDGDVSMEPKDAVKEALSEMFVVSEVELPPDPSVEPADLDRWCYSRVVEVDLDIAGPATKREVLVEVRPPAGDKCPRCWRWVVEKRKKDASPEPEQDVICYRCEDVMRERGMDLT